MELNYLKEFTVLAQVGNYLEAADQLYISQSSLSRHIKAMEDELGATLLNRSTRKLSLSEFGKIFLPYAQQIVRLQQEYQTELFNYRRNIHGTLSIGSIPSITQYHIIDLLFRFQQENKNYSLNLIEGDPLQLTQMVREDQLELAFIRAGEEPDSHFARIDYAWDTLAAVMPTSHPLAAKDHIRLSELADETLLLLSSDTFMYQLCVRACQSAGFDPHVGYTGRRSENILAMVEKGAGIALLTQHPIRRPVNPGISIVEIRPRISTSICLIYKKDRKLSPPARQFVSLMKDMADDQSCLISP